MTDFSQVPPRTVEPNESIDNALNEMKLHGVHLVFTPVMSSPGYITNPPCHRRRITAYNASFGRPLPMWDTDLDLAGLHYWGCPTEAVGRFFMQAQVR